MRNSVFLALGAAVLAAPIGAMAQEAPGFTIEKIEDGPSFSAQLFDTDGDYSFSADELAEQLGPQSARFMMQLADSNGDGMLAIEELYLLQASSSAAPVSLPGRYFHFEGPMTSATDTNGDGALDAGELASLRARTPEILNGMFDRSIDHYDVDGDGALSAEEYAAGIRLDD